MAGKKYEASHHRARCRRGGGRSCAGAVRASELIVNSYGGPYEAIIQERIIAPFEKQFGIKVIYDAAGSASQDYAKIKATRGRPGFDVVVMTASESLAGCKDGLLEKLNADSGPQSRATRSQRQRDGRRLRRRSRSAIHVAAVPQGQDRPAAGTPGRSSTVRS